MKLQAFVTAVLLIAACAVQAEPTPVAGSLAASTDKTPDKASASGTPDAATGDDSKDASHAASVMREHLAREEQLVPPPNSRVSNQPPGQLSKGQVIQARPDGAEGGFASSIKDFVRPIQEGVAQSGVMEAVRNFEADMGLSKRPDNADPASRGYSAGAPGTGAPARTAEQIRRDQIASSMMLEEFINEVKPWAFGLAGLLVLGYLVRLWLTYLRVKAARPGKRRRSARRRSSRTQ